jgi:hypothetical protein
VSGDHDDRQRAAHRLQRPDQLHAVDLGHAQVGDHTAAGLGLHRGQELGGRQEAPRRQPVDLQEEAERMQSRFVIVNDEHCPAGR